MIELTPQNLRDLYWTKHMSQRGIATHLGINRNIIVKQLKMAGIPQRQNSGPRGDLFKVAEVAKADSEEMAYIAGVIEGDGSLSSEHITLIVKSQKFAEVFSNALAKVMGRTRPYRISKTKDALYRVSCRPRNLHRFLSDKSNVVKLAAAHPTDYIRGFYDSEGCYSSYNVKWHGKIYGPYPSVRMFNTKIWRLELVGRLLERLGISFRIGLHQKARTIRASTGKEYHCRACYSLAIHTKSIPTFLSAIRPNIKLPKTIRTPWLRVIDL